MFVRRGREVEVIYSPYNYRNSAVEGAKTLNSL